MTATRIDGKAFAEKVRDEVSEGVKSLQASHGVTPGLAVVLVGGSLTKCMFAIKSGRPKPVVCNHFTMFSIQRLLEILFCRSLSR